MGTSLMKDPLAHTWKVGQLYLDLVPVILIATILFQDSQNSG